MVCLRETTPAHLRHCEEQLPGDGALRSAVQVDQPPRPAAAEEITKTSMHAVISSPDEIDIKSFHESLQPYVKHYIFMVKRNGK